MSKIGAGGQLRKTATHSAIYAIGTIISRLTGLVMLPIYTRYLSPADYGVIELLSMAIEITGILVGLRISQAMFRFYILEEDGDEKKKIVSTVLLTALAASFSGASILYIAAEPLSALIFGSSEYQYEFQLFSFTLITNAVISVGQAYMRARQKPILYVLIGTITLVIQVVLNVIFVVMMEMHVKGVIYSALGSGAVVAIGYLLYIFSSVGFYFSGTIARRLISFIAPLILASLGAFYVAYADKYFIRMFGSLTEVGLYALAARVTAIIGMVYQSFNSSWSADRFEIVKHKNAKIIFSQVFRFLSAALVIMGVGLALFAGDLFHIMTSQEYYSAANIVPFLVLASIARTYVLFCNFGIMLGERTRHIAEANWLKVVVSSVGYILLIPYLGVYGAAITLLVGSLVELYWVNKKAKQEYDMELRWHAVGILFAAGFLCVLIGFLMPIGGLIWFWSRLVLFIFFIYLIYELPVWHDSDRELIKASIKRVKALVVKGTY